MPADLPTDPAECQRLLRALLRENDELRRVLDETAACHAEALRERDALAEELAAYKRWVLGRRSERLSDPNQRTLFELAPEEGAQAAEPEPETTPVQGHRRKRRPRRFEWSTLPAVEIQHDLPESDKTCQCCGRAKDRIGQDETHVLEYVPAKLEHQLHIRPKFACRYCQDGVASPPPPTRPLSRRMAGPGLIAEILASKFGDHLPLYRLEDVFARRGLAIPRSTQCEWVAEAAELLRPLYELQKQLVLRSPLLWTDDTPLTFLDPRAKPAARKGRLWAYIGDEEHPYAVYDFTESWSRDGPAAFLKDWRGYLHADAYAGYDGIYLAAGQEILEVACWAHARRKFFDARTAYPRQCHQVLEWIRQLYDIEDRARELSAAERVALRVSESIPVLDKLAAYLAELSAQALPKSSLGKALGYALNQWAALRRFTSDGRLTIDNNVSERTLRPQALGRKNWLFLGSPQAGRRAAVLFTLLAGAKRHRLEPWAYLRAALLTCSGDIPDLESLLPERWAKAHPEHILAHRLEESRRRAARKKQIRQHRRTHR